MFLILDKQFFSVPVLLFKNVTQTTKFLNIKQRICIDSLFLFYKNYAVLQIQMFLEIKKNL